MLWREQEDVIEAPWVLQLQGNEFFQKLCELRRGPLALGETPALAFALIATLLQFKSMGQFKREPEQRGPIKASKPCPDSWPMEIVR